MQTTLYMAASLDGFIADTDKSEDFLSTYNWDKFVELAENAGSFVVGRKTYENVKEWENHSYEDVDANRIVLTNDEEYQLSESYEKAQSVQQAIQISDDNDTNLIVTGGSTVNSAFLEENKIDKVNYPDLVTHRASNAGS